MTDNQIFILIRNWLVQALPAYGVTVDSDQILQNYQPVQEGRFNGTSIYFTKIGDGRYGSPREESVWDEAGQIETTKITQIIEGTFQFACTVQNGTTDAMQLTAADVLKRVGMSLQVEKFRQYWRVTAGKDSGIQRVAQVRTSQVMNDRDQWENNPTFDVVINHTDIIDVAEDILTTIEARILRV